MGGLTRRAIFMLPGAAVMASGLARADASYPARAVRIMVPFVPGGTTDVIARIVAAGLGEELGQQFFIENRGGAGGTLGADAVAKAAPDGYTLLVFHIGMVYGPALFKQLPYDVLKDFAPVAMLGSAPSVLIVSPDQPFRAVADLIAAAKRKPGEINYGSAGVGSSGHLAVELFQTATGAKVTHVPFRGGNPAVMAVIGGQVQFMIETAGTIMPQLKGGTLRALAVTGDARIAELRDVPTMREAGVADYVYTTWYGVWAPANTAPAIIGKLNKAAEKVLGKADVKARLANAGIEPTTVSPERFGEIIRADLDKWSGIIRAAGIAPQ